MPQYNHTANFEIPKIVMAARLMTGALGANPVLCLELAASMMWARVGEAGEWGEGRMTHLATSATRFLDCASSSLVDMAFSRLL